MNHSRQIQQSVRVRPFIIIPSHDLEKLRIEFCAGRCIDDGAVWAAIVVAAHKLLICHPEYSDHTGFRGATERSQYLGQRGWLFGADGEINH